MSWPGSTEDQKDGLEFVASRLPLSGLDTTRPRGGLIATGCAGDGRGTRIDPSAGARRIVIESRALVAGAARPGAGCPRQNLDATSPQSHIRRAYGAETDVGGYRGTAAPPRTGWMVGPASWRSDRFTSGVLRAGLAGDAAGVVLYFVDQRRLCPVLANVHVDNLPGLIEEDRGWHPFDYRERGELG